MFQGRMSKLFVVSLFIVSIMFGISVSYADSPSEEKIDKAWDLYVEGDYNKALKLLDEVLSTDSENQEAYYLRGTVYCHLKKYPRAIQDLNKALELDSEDYMSYNERGDAYYFLHKYEDALNDYNKAIALDPTEEDYYANRALVYYTLEQYTKALVDINKAIELDPNDSYFTDMRDDIKSAMKDGGAVDRDLAERIKASLRKKSGKRNGA